MHFGVHVRSCVAVIFGIGPRIHLVLLDQIEVEFLSYSVDHPLLRGIIRTD
jgi:hypothetical protein